MRRLPQPDPDDVQIEGVYCFGCGRKVAVTRGPVKRAEVFCEELCWHLEQLVSLENASRDRMIWLLGTQGIGHKEIAEVFDLSRSRIPQLLATDNNLDYLLAGRK